MELSIRGMFRPSLAQLRCYRGFTLYLWRCRQVATILKLAQASFILPCQLAIANYSNLMLIVVKARYQDLCLTLVGIRPLARLLSPSLFVPSSNPLPWAGLTFFHFLRKNSASLSLP